jgi:hypothetical protein
MGSVKSEVLKAAFLKIQVFRKVTPLRIADIYRRLEGWYSKLGGKKSERRNIPKHF